ncbi:MAG: hypothetical protein Q9159_006803 [Coniocarpon cinnabarinum]
MSQRYGPSPDIRFVRERSPPRTNSSSMHSSRAGNVDPRPREGIPDAPRGPRATSDSFRPYGAPRGRGLSRGDYRPDFRDRDSFRRDPSPPSGRRGDFRGGRAWSPSLDREGHRDYFDQSRDVDGSRGRGRYRDSAPGRFVEGRGSHSYYPPRDDGSRGRGQFYSGRGRARGGFHDDRGGFRGRSPSPPGRNRWIRSPSPPRERRPSDRFEDDRPERRNSEKSHDRDERLRDDDRPRGSDRYQPGPNPTTPLSYRPTHSLPQSNGRGAQDGERDLYQPRRRQSGSDVRDRAYDSFRPEPAPKREAQRSDQQHSSRPPSPPRPPEVPAFGSLPTKTPVSEQPPWNKWTAGEQRSAPPRQPQPPPSPPQAASAHSIETHADESAARPPMTESKDQDLVKQAEDVHKVPSVASNNISPKIEPLDVAPKAPKAQRREPSPAGSEGSEAISSMRQESPKSTAPTNAPAAPAPKGPMMPQESSPLVLRSPPTGPRQLTTVSAGPKASLSPLVSRATLSSPGFNPPTGPRAGPLLSPQLSSSVPTGPRADRSTSTISRPPFPPSGPASWQWNRQDPQGTNSRSAVVPAKRDLSSERKTLSASQPYDERHKSLVSKQQSIQPDSHTTTNDDNTSASKRQKIDTNDSIGDANQPLGELKATESASEEDTIDEDDSERREKQFQETKARLEAQKIDLSARHLRGCSPLRKLNLLSRLALEDLSAFFETPLPRTRKPTSQRLASQQDVKSPSVMEATTEPGINEQLIPAPVLRAPPEPKQAPKLFPSPISSPEVQSLPFLNHAPPTPLSDIDVMKENQKRHETLESTLHLELRRRHEDARASDDELRVEYENYYRAWRKQWRVSDMQHKIRDDTERHEQTDAAGPQSATEVSPPLPTPGESRRRGLHATDYELEKVLEMSKLEAEQAAKEQQERDAVNAKPNWDVEAVIPALRQSEDIAVGRFADMSCFRNPREMVKAWELDPETDNFTKEEHDTMLTNFKDFPKKFGKIAEGLEGRTYKDCINHYYATKWNSQYKPPKDKRRKPKTPRVKSGPNARPRANNLISNLNEDAKPDLYDGDEAAAPLNAYTDSGRPKRAAAPTFKDKEGQIEPLSLNTPAKKNGKVELNGERAGEKSGRKRAATTKEPRARKQRGPLVRRDSRSPEKMDAEPPGAERSQPTARDLEVANSLAALGGSQSSLLQRPSNAPAFSVEPSQSRTPMGPEAGKIQTVRSGNATGTSSYWSVQEVDIFPSLVEKHGTDWYAIAEQMGSKSHTMVKNYFNRIKTKIPEVEKAARDADERKQRSELGSAGGSSSTPALAKKRVKEPSTTTTTQSRPLAPTSATEVIELDDEDQSSSAVPPPRVPPAETIAYTYPRQDPPLSREPQGEPGNSIRPYSNASFAQSYAPISQPLGETRTYAHREPVMSEAMPTGPQYAPMARPMEFGPVSNSQPSLSRPSYQSVRPGVEDVHYRAPPRVSQPLSTAENASGYASASSGVNVVPRPPVRERTISDDIHQSQPLRRAPSPTTHAPFRHLAGDTSSRPRSTPFFEPWQTVAHATPAHDEPRMPSRGNMEKPQPPAPSAPKRSNLMSILNNDEPSDPQPSRPASGPIPQPIRKNPTPPLYGTAIPAPSYPPPPPPRPSSRVERFEYPSNDAMRRSSLTSYQTPSYLPPAHQPTRPPADTRESLKLHPGSFRIPWPPPEDQPPQPPPPLPMQQRTQHEPAPFEHRAPLRHLDSRFDPSPPPSYMRDGGPTSGHNSPFNQRTSLQHLTNRVEQSPPPGRPYAYPAPTSHTREASISHLNPSRRAPPPSVLQPQHAPRSTLAQQAPPSVPPVMVSRSDPVPSYAARDYKSYAPAEPAPPRPLYVSRPPEPEPSAPELRYETDKAWIRAAPAREDDRERRPTDWMQGIAREPRFGPASSNGGGSTGTPSQGQPQYAPYNPIGERSGSR